MSNFLSDEDSNILLGEVKAYCGITWNDEMTEMQLKGYIASSAARLSQIYGGVLHFSGHMTSDDYLAKDLLLARCFYAREKALDDFENNYRSELLTLRNHGKVKNSFGSE